MKSTVLIYVLCSASVMLLSDGEFPPRPESIKPKPFRFEPPEIEVEKLDNGVKFFTLTDSDSPLIKLFLMFNGGAVTDPPDRLGLSAFGLEMLKAGGCKGLLPDTLDERIDSLAAHFSFSTAQERLTISLSVLPEDFKDAVELLFRMLTEPAFNEGALKYRRRLWVEELRRSYGNAVNIARLLFRKALYLGTPYANPELGLPDKVEKIERSDVVEWHRKWIRPDNACVGLVGPINDGMVPLLKKRLKEWKVEGEAGRLKEWKVKRKAGMRIYLYQRSGLKQVTIITGSLSAERTHSERPIIDMLEYFISARVNVKVRNEKGLAYSAYASYSPAKTAGMFYVEAQTKMTSAVQALRLMVEQLSIAGEVLPTHDAIRCVKNYFLNSFIFRYANKADLLEYSMTLKFYGFADDYLTGYCEAIKEVTPDDIATAGMRFIEKDALVAVMVGDVEGLRGQLKRCFPDAEIHLLSSLELGEEGKKR